jgi:hypothetical protein
MLDEGGHFAEGALEATIALGARDADVLCELEAALGGDEVELLRPNIVHLRPAGGTLGGTIGDGVADGGVITHVVIIRDGWNLVRVWAGFENQDV